MPHGGAPRLKRNDQSSKGRVRKVEGNNQWGRIVDYFSQETSSTSISGVKNEMRGNSKLLLSILTFRLKFRKESAENGSCRTIH
jgi:hypothetical protein